MYEGIRTRIARRLRTCGRPATRLAANLLPSVPVPLDVRPADEDCAGGKVSDTRDTEGGGGKLSTSRRTRARSTTHPALVPDDSGTY